MRDRIERWVPAGAFLAAGVALATDAYGQQGVDPVSVILLIVLLVAAWWMSPLHRGRHVDHAEAQARAEDDDLVIYWKPGCRHCIELLARLGAERDRAIWVNVWRDDDAATFVAEHNDGNVLTPTVFTGAGQRVPRDVETVRSHLTAQRVPDR